MIQRVVVDGMSIDDAMAEAQEQGQLIYDKYVLAETASTDPAARRSPVAGSPVSMIPGIRASDDGANDRDLEQIVQPAAHG